MWQKKRFVGKLIRCVQRRHQDGATCAASVASWMHLISRSQLSRRRRFLKSFVKRSWSTTDDGEIAAERRNRKYYGATCATVYSLKHRRWGHVAGYCCKHFRRGRNRHSRMSPVQVCCTNDHRRSNLSVWILRKPRELYRVSKGYNENVHVLPVPGPLTFFCY